MDLINFGHFMVVAVPNHTVGQTGGGKGVSAGMFL